MANKDVTHRTKLERLEQQQKKIAAEIRKEKTKLKAQERKDDTRRKVLLGALASSHMEKDPHFKATCDRLLREGLTRNADRALFGLPPLLPTENT